VCGYEMYSLNRATKFERGMSYTWRTLWVRNFGFGNVSEVIKNLNSFLRGQTDLHVFGNKFDSAASTSWTYSDLYLSLR
jgi:hypothetical protein